MDKDHNLETKEGLLQDTRRAREGRQGHQSKFQAIPKRQNNTKQNKSTSKGDLIVRSWLRVSENTLSLNGEISQEPNYIALRAKWEGKKQK